MFLVVFLGVFGGCRGGRFFGEGNSFFSVSEWVFLLLVVYMFGWILVVVILLGNCLFFKGLMILLGEVGCCRLVKSGFKFGVWLNVDKIKLFLDFVFFWLGCIVGKDWGSLGYDSFCWYSFKVVVLKDFVWLMMFLLVVLFLILSFFIWFLIVLVRLYIRLLRIW